MTEQEYTRHDLLKVIADTYPDCYASQSGNLKAALASVLIQVEVHDPELFKKIMNFEMGCQKAGFTKFTDY